MLSCGINIGSSSLKLVIIDNGQVVSHRVIEHEGDFIGTLRNEVERTDIPENIRTIVTGTEGRHLVNIDNVIESICVEEALGDLGYNVDAVVSLGGEDFVVYTIDIEGKIITSFSGNKCASGTGEFFKQQLGRMDMSLSDIHSIPEDSRVYGMSSRCSVFMKSDCTHKLNKGEATKGDIVLSLSDVMATKVTDFLSRARITNGRVLLVGGVTKNSHIVQFVRDKMPGIEFLIPEEAHYFEAYGAALLAKTRGTPLLQAGRLFKSHDIGFGRYPELKTAEGKVTFISHKRGMARPGGQYIMGVDGGSTTTKAALVDYDTHEIVAEHYGRTHGDPVAALKKCLVEIKKQLRDQIGDQEISIPLVSTTGSSREILGVFLETPAVYNEIIAHSVGTTFFRDDIDTIFEIGGQDAKYVLLKNGVPIDYAMNEACSAGTGSFLEESAAGDLNIMNVEEIGDIALRAENPLKFGEHCSAFINSDIRKAIQYGATREDITAGIITSIVSNYLNRVVGNRLIGKRIVLQGGVAKNRAVPLAFAMLLGKEITVPPDPELLGCFGVALMAKQKHEQGLLDKGSFDMDAIMGTDIVYEREFTCRSCDNHCPVRVLNVNGNRYMFGGRCDKYANMRKKKDIDESGVYNYVNLREELLFERFAPDPDDLVKKHDFVIGVPRAFSVYTLWPFYSWFFHTLGIETRLSQEVCPEGVARVESAYCFPAEIAHGAVQDTVNMGTDYIFVPHFRDMPSHEQGVHACFCPITQSLPYYIKKAFPDVPESRFLMPVVSLKYGRAKALEGFAEMGKILGIQEADISAAFDAASEKQQEFFREYRNAGREAMERARAADHPVIALLGRPYNAFTRDANMGIPLKFATRGYSVIPYDMIPFEGSEIFDNMYWYYGQEDMHAAVALKNEDNIFVTYISNFSCAPDSFMLHYVKWIMGTKPFLILELDSHSADAGIDTRVEAFLDIIEGYRMKFSGGDRERYDNGLRFVNNGKDRIHVRDVHNDRRIEIFGNKKVHMLLSNMGRLSAELLAACLRGIDINASAMPLPDTYTLQLARGYMSGKECLPSQLVLGSALKYLASDSYDPDEIYLLFVPVTTGPCRTGQYFVFYENLFRDLGIKNVVVVTLSSDNSYNELGPSFSKSAWWGLIIADYMKDIETSLRTCAVDPETAIARYDELWQGLIDIAEKDITTLLPSLKKVAREISRIPLKRNIRETPKVLIIGEIYVRRDDFAVDELIRIFSKRGIIAKVSGVSEWIYYCDHTRRYELRKRLKLLPWYRRPFSREARDLFLWKMEELYKHGVEKRVKAALGVTGLIPETPHNMNEIMENTERYFVTGELESEIAISSGMAATSMMRDYSGLVNISPFACLIGRVIEGLITPWARERRYPVISVEVDGDILPPNMVNKLDIFMLNVLRHRKECDVSQLIESPEDPAVTLSRRIIRN